MNHGLDTGNSSPADGGARREPSVQSRHDERPLGEVVNDVWQRAELLLQQELQLARADVDERTHRLKSEITQQLTALKAELLVEALGILIVLAGGLAITAGVILALGKVLPPWVAAALVGAALSGTGIFVIKRSTTQTPHGLAARDLMPQRSLNSIDQDIKAIKEATHHDNRE